MLIECRRILRDFKLEYGFAPGEVDEVHAYGLFLTRNGNIYYRGYPVDIAGQPERLLNMFLSAPGHCLPHYEIMNLDGEGSGSPRKRVSALRKILRKCSRRDLIKTSNYEAERQTMSISAQIDAIKQQFPDLDITFVTNPDGTVGESMSAAKPGRPLFNQMMSDLESGKYQGVIAWHPDRLSRNSPDASLIVWYIQQGIIQDLKFCNFYFEPTPEGIMMLQMIMSQAQYYSAKLSKDIKRGNAKKRKLGGTTGVAPIGYINNTADHAIEPDPERFDLVRHAFDLMLTGNFSVGEIARIMNEEWGFLLLKRKKSGGKPVSKQGLYNVFRNKLYAGIIIDPYTKEEIPAKHQPMITLEEYDRIQEILCGKGQPRLPHNKEFPYKGFIKCGECGCSITAEHKTKHHKDGTTKEEFFLL